MQDFSEKLERCFLQDDPVTELKQLALSLKQAGRSRDEIYKVFLDAHLSFENSNRIKESDTLGDVMDMFTGWYVGSNFEL